MTYYYTSDFERLSQGGVFQGTFVCVTVILLYPILYWSFLRRYQSDSMHLANLLLIWGTWMMFASWPYPVFWILSILNLLAFPVIVGLHLLIPMISILTVFTERKKIEVSPTILRRQARNSCAIYYSAIAIWIAIYYLAKWPSPLS